MVFAWRGNLKGYVFGWRHVHGTLIKTYCVLVLYIAITIHRELYIFESDNWFVLSQRCLLFWKEKRKKKKDRMVLITSINARQIRLHVARRPETCAEARQPTLITTRPGNRIEVQGCNQIRYMHITGSVQSRQLLSRAASKHAHNMWSDYYYAGYFFQWN